jgi:hypothetical protein
MSRTKPLKITTPLVSFCKSKIVKKKKFKKIFKRKHQKDTLVG